MATGTIDQLNFEVILHDDKFNAQIAKDKEAAKKLNMTLSQYLTAKKKEAAVIAQVEKARLQHERVLRSENAQYKTQSTLLRQLGTLAGTYFSVRGAERFVRSLVDITGEFEKQKMALTSMLQSSEASDRIFNQYRQLALKSPYTFQDFTKFGKQLLAFNIPQEELVNTTKMLADVAAGLGVDMGRIILAYGQIKSAGVLKGTELRQLTEAGVPILDSLAKQIEETTGKAVKLGDVFGMISKKQIPFEMVEEAFRRMTSEGGKFYNMQEVLVETLWGKIGKLRDVWQQTLYDFGSGSSINKFLKGSVDLVTQLVTHLDSIGKVLAPIIAGFGAYGTALAAVAVGQKALDLLNFIKALKGVAAGSKAAASALTMMGGAGKAAAVSLGAIAVLGVAIYEIAKAVKKHNEEANKMNTILRENDNALESEKGKLDELNMKLKLNAKGTKEWNDAKNQAVSQYGQYFNKLNDEITKVGDLSTAYDTLTASIEESVRARQVADFMQKEEELIDKGNKDALDKIQKDIYKEFTNRGEAYLLTHAINKTLTSGGHIQDLLKDERVRDLVYRDEDTVQMLIKPLTQLFARNLAARQNYVKDLKTLINAYGLEGTEFDPDFNGPIPKRVTPNPTNTNAPHGTTPTKEVEALYDWDEVLRELDKQLMDDIDKDTKRFEKEFDARMKAMAEFDNFLDEIEHTSSERGGSGAVGKARDILFSYKEDDYKVLVEYRKQLDNIKTAYNENSAAYANAKKKLDEWRKTAEGVNMSKMVKNMSGIADDIFKEGMFGYDLTNWSDKPLTEILKIRKALKELKVPEPIQKLFEGKEDGLKQLEQDLLDLVNKTLQGTVDPAAWKSVVKGAHALAADFNDAAQALLNYANATGNEKLAESVKVISGVIQNVEAAEKGAEAWGGWWGAIIGGAINIFSQVTNAIADSKNEANGFADAIENIRSEVEKTRIQKMFEGSIFGSAVDMEKANRELDALKKNMAEMGAIYKGNIISRYTSSGREASAFRTKKKGTDEWTELYVLAERMQMDLYDKYGNLNAELLRNILTVYEETLTAEEKTWLENAASFSENFIAIMNQVEDEVSDIFDQIADSAADSIIDRWIEAGDAALDYKDILDDVARSYAKMLIKSAILKNVLNEDEADAIVQQYLSGNTEAAMATIAEDMQKIAGMEPLFASIMDVFDPYLNKEGSEDTLANGINKQLVEGNSSLIASYINAMRADLSAQRADVSGIRGDVSAILGGIGVLPTLNDYLAQVAADAHDTAQSNRQILTEIQSVITSASGRRAIAVDVQ